MYFVGYSETHYPRLINSLFASLNKELRVKFQLFISHYKSDSKHTNLQTSKQD